MFCIMSRYLISNTSFNVRSCPRYSQLSFMSSKKIPGLVPLRRLPETTSLQAPTALWHVGFLRPRGVEGPRGTSASFLCGQPGSDSETHRENEFHRGLSLGIRKLRLLLLLLLLIYLELKDLLAESNHLINEMRRRGGAHFLLFPPSHPASTVCRELLTRKPSALLTRLQAVMCPSNH